VVRPGKFRRYGFASFLSSVTSLIKWGARLAGALVAAAALAGLVLWLKRYR
jgi:hypothetical protein